MVIPGGLWALLLSMLRKYPIIACSKRLAVESAQPRKASAIDAFVESMENRANSDPGYLELEVWYDGPYRKLVTARLAAKTRAAKRKAEGLRKPADVELRPPDVKHQYRYALHA